MLEDTDGPLVGYDRESRPVRLSSTALYGGVALLGEPGGVLGAAVRGEQTHQDLPGPQLRLSLGCQVADGPHDLRRRDHLGGRIDPRDR